MIDIDCQKKLYLCGVNYFKNCFIMDQPKIERVLRLMMMMMGNVDYTVNELADKLDTSPRSIYRYIDTLKSAGFVISKNSNNVFKLNKMDDKYAEISNLIHFSEEEAYVVDKMINALDDRNVLKRNLHKKLASVYNCTGVVDCIVKGRNAENVHKIIDAINGKLQVRLINYASSNSGVVRDRLVEPFGFTTDYNQIWCYDLEDGKNKLFKTVRVERVEVLKEGWVCEFEHKEGFVDIFRYSGFNRYRAKVELDVKARNVVIENYPLSEKYIVKLRDDLWFLDVEVCSEYVKEFAQTTDGAKLISIEKVDN